MAFKDMLQFVGDVKLILQGIKMLAKTAGDPLQELVFGLDRKVDEFESYLRTLTHRNNRGLGDNELAGSEFGESRVLNDGFTEASPSNHNVDAESVGQKENCAYEELCTDWSGRNTSEPANVAGGVLNPVALIANASVSTPNEERLIEIVTADDQLGEDGNSPIAKMQTENEKTIMESSGDSRLRCPTCRKGFTKSGHLRQHVFIKHQGGTLEKQVCPFCGKSFESKYLKGHIATTHEGKEARCESCAKTFASVSALNVHRKSVHGGRRFACHNCHKSFASKYGLEIHFGKEHDQRTFPCTLCDSVLKSENLLRRHMQGVHEGIRHACPTCSASFTQKSQLTYHVQLKHGNGDQKGRETCEKCHKVFVVPWKMRLHRQKCVSSCEGNVGYAKIAASLASIDD